MNALRRLTTVLAALFPRLPRPLPAKEHRRVISAAHAEDLDGMAALYLSGTHYEMGYQHGTLARQKIRAFRRDAYAYMADLIQGAFSWPRWLARLLARPLLYWQATAYWDTVPPEYLAEAQGVADGASLHPIEVVLVTAIWEMVLVGGCSEFVVTGEMTADGSLTHGYNYDLMAPEHALINPYLAMIFYRPAGGIPFSTLNTVGSVGANAGMSDAGLSVAWDNTYASDRSLYEGVDLPVVPFIVTLRRVLERCRSLDEAVSTVVDTLPRPLADIVIVASAAEDRAVALETAGGVHAARPLTGGAVWSTNCFRSDALAPHERRGDWREMDEDELAQVFPRYASYEMLFRRHHGRMTSRLALDALRDPYPREAEGEIYAQAGQRTTICRAVTGFSLVMQPGLGLIWASDGKLPAPQGHFYAFEQPAWQRRPELDFRPTGFRPALACAEACLRGDAGEAWDALAQALAADGETAPLVLMRAVLQRARGDEAGFQADLECVVERWGATPIGAVARAWAAGQEADLPAIPFPSAIAPQLSFHAAAEPGQRVREKRTLLAVFAHPDDESFGPGGTLARYAAEGIDVHLICATDGEAGMMDEECVADDRDPAERRVAELRCAVKELGLSGLHLLGYRDSGMAGSPDNEHPDCLAQADPHDVAGQITGYIRKLCPQVVITFDPMGGYLHPDHIATHHATVTAFHAASDRTAYPEQLAQGLTTHAPQKLYYTGLPRRALRWLVRLMRLLGRDPTSVGRNGDINLVEIAAIDCPLTARIDVTDYLAIKDAAAACHRSQGGSDRRLPRWLVRRIMSTEGFTRAHPEVKPGEPIERDLFAGVV